MRKNIRVLIALIAVISLLLSWGCSSNGNSAKAVSAPMAMATQAEYYGGEEADTFAPNEPSGTQPEAKIEHNTEEYKSIVENEFLEAVKNPLSTFSIDVDTASYANVRRFINYNQMPPQDAVRIEEMINYFDYSYKKPEKEEPFSINMEYSKCPWNKDNKLVLVGLKGKEIENPNIPSNLTFLIDVSGSMSDENKLPLIKKSLKMLVNNLKENDRVAIVVYASSEGVALPSTSGKDKNKILSVLDRLESGGSTAGGAGIMRAYAIAKENFIEDGNNRIILATDGDFNVGISSTSEMVKMIEEKRNDGIFLTILGFGTGNIKDSRVEEMADKGNGNYYYIDNILEAKKVFIDELNGTLFTIAKDVKIQVEFNPTKVKSYRLIGYENRMLKKEDFENDKKDAGELGAGHTVTAIYEIETNSGKETKEENLKYQTTKVKESAYNTDEVLTVNLRYKEPKEDTSKLITKICKDGDYVENAPENLTFASSVAEFSMLLRNSKFKGTSSYDNVIELAKKAKGEDKYGYRNEFISLVEKAKLLAK